MHLETMKAFSGVILVASLLGVSVHGGHIQEIPRFQENPTILNRDFTAGLNRDFTVSVGFFPRVPTLQDICTQNGIFPVTDTCNQFYICEDLTGVGLEWSVNRFTCPQGTLYNVDSKVCTLSSIVASRPECQIEEELHGENVEAATYSDVDEGILKRRKRRASAANDIVRQSEETCDVISNVDTYIRHIKSKRPLQLTSTDNRSYKTILAGYNSDLGKAKRNTDAWRTRNGVFDKLHATYRLTKMFGQKLNAKFKDTQERVQFLSNPLLPDISKVEEKIKTIKERIQRINETITAVATDHPALAVLENELKENEQDLRRLVEDENRQKILCELQELKKFFEYVKNNANEIRNEALGTKAKMENFLHDVEQDFFAFNRQTDSAQTLMDNLRRQQRGNNVELASNQREIERLSREIEKESSERSETQRDIDRAYNDYDALVRKIASERRDAETRISVGAPLLAIPIFGWIAGGVLLGTGVSDRNSLIRQRDRASDNHQKLIDNYNSMINAHNSAIESFKRRSSSLEEESRDIDSKLANFDELNRDLRYVKDNVNSIRPLLNKAVEGIGNIQTYFNGVVANLQIFITAADEARTEAEANNARNLAYNSINNMKTYWDNASDKILELGNCS